MSTRIIFEYKAVTYLLVNVARLLGESKVKSCMSKIGLQPDTWNVKPETYTQ